ncbi:hypothetical protein BBK36DRAFT_1002631 [Trichoderma citrinoviride]|uniref:Uncharacterized protein n=1 Tax=Trichoderma citrinoviride TaxID=58853 RepID=A0A2T4BML9_9HYPO|nr:hypothetical protein BBK36DRAFT_1002631 [Trichoderma citrinoviride]PTB70509.1 hypothetical protein BBK36DRAFT_1002631 [Trichoderma citrinoviride]
MRRQRRCAAVDDAVRCERRRLEAQGRGLGAVKMHEALTLSYQSKNIGEVGVSGFEPCTCK